MDCFIIERRGGFAGIRGHGEIDADSLDQEDRDALEKLLRRKRPLPADRGADRYVYIVTRKTESGSKTCEVPETLMPRSVAWMVKDQI
jgi:hypothetical protein